MANQPRSPLAKITILDAAAGKRFIADHNAPRQVRGRRRIHWGGRELAIGESRDKPSELALQSLRESSRGAVSTTHEVQQRNAPRANTRFPGGQLECGRWDYIGGQLTFISHFQDYRNGDITIGRKQAILMLGPSGSDQCRIDINYHDTEDIVLEGSSIILNLRFAPKIFMIKGEDEMATLMQHLSLGSNKPGRKKKIRVPAMSTLHAAVTGSCWTYRFMLTNSADVSSVRKLLGMNGRMCSIHLFDARRQLPLAGHTLADDFGQLQHQLTMSNKFGSKPFALRFQLDRLARNGYLTPSKVIMLLPVVTRLLEAYSLQSVLTALRHLARELPFAGPHTDHLQLSIDNLDTSLRFYCAKYDEASPTNPYELAKRYAHVNLIHKIIVTPSGVRLEGPEAEPTNRVLRTYSYATDAFVRVEFRDDDGAAVRYEARTDLTPIYHQRFKDVLDTNVLTCGSAYSFLGFSHSSLRSQSCWFMRPFVDTDRELMLAELLLKRLGDFEGIRTPAKV